MEMSDGSPGKRMLTTAKREAEEESKGWVGSEKSLEREGRGSTSDRRETTA